jgi:D-proline reductase (dithiol) PrdB
MRPALLVMERQTFDAHSWVAGPALRQRRVAPISTAGLHRRDERPFAATSGNAPAIAGDYRLIPHTIAAKTW